MTVPKPLLSAGALSLVAGALYLFSAFGAQAAGSTSQLPAFKCVVSKTGINVSISYCSNGAMQCVVGRSTDRASSDVAMHCIP